MDKCLVAQSCKTEHDDCVLQWQVWCWLHTFITTTMITGWAQGSQILQSVYKWAAIKLVGTRNTTSGVQSRVVSPNK